LELGQYEDAEASYQKMIDARPEAATYERVGYLRWVEGDPQGAIEVLQLAATATPQSDGAAVATVLTELGEAYAAAGDADEAAHAFEIALARDQRCARAHLMRARLALEAGRVDEAIAENARAVELDGRAEHRWAYASALEKKQLGGEAKAQREAAL